MQDPVTTRYADALFNVARREGALDEVAQGVRELAEALARPDADAFLADARIPADERREKVRALVPGAHPLLADAVELLFDKRREGALAGLGAAFRRRELAERGAVEGVVEAARPLADADVARLAEAVGRRISADVQLRPELRPELIGGVRVIVASKMIDQSVRGRLEALRKRMEDAPLPVASLTQ